MNSDKLSQKSIITISTENLKIQITTKTNQEKKYKPEKNEITNFDENLNIKREWFTQFYYGCLLFSLMNGNYVDSTYKRFFTKNADFSHKFAELRTKTQVIKGVSHEYKAIVLWNILADNNLIPNCRKNISEKIKEMLKDKDLNSAYKIALCIYDLLKNFEERFAVKDKRDFADGLIKGWTFNNYKVEILDDTRDKKLLSLKLNYLERLPKNSLFCDVYNHWMVFLGCKNDKMYFYDSYLHDELRELDKKYVALKTISILKKQD